jgi:hypothetical protein
MSGAIENSASLRAQLHYFLLPRPRFLHVILVMQYLQDNQLGEDGPAPQEDDAGEPD